MPKQAKGWLRRKNYAEGEVWLYCFYTCRPTDKKRVENYEIIGLVRDFHSEAEAWQEASRLGYAPSVEAFVCPACSFLPIST